MRITAASDATDVLAEGEGRHFVEKRLLAGTDFLGCKPRATVPACFRLGKDVH